MRTLSTTLALLGGLLLSVSPAHARFWDVPDDHMYGEAIDYLMSEGIVRGYPDRSFRADLPVSRAEFTKIVVGSLFSPLVIESCVENLSGNKEALDVIRFEDVSYLDWYGPYLCTAILAEILSGYPDGTFKPEDGVNFAEAAKILANAYGILNPERHNIRTQQGIWYKPYVEDLQDFNAIPPTIRGFEYPITRGEMAEMIFRLANAHIGQTLNSRRTLTYPDLAETIPRTPYISKDYGFALSYPKNWHAPYFQKRGIAQDGVPVVRSDWRIYFGYTDEQCLGHGDCQERNFYLDGYSRMNLDQLITDFYNESGITVLEDILEDTFWTLVYEDASQGCSSKRALVIASKYVYRLTGLCVTNNATESIQFDQLLRSFSLIEKTR